MTDGRERQPLLAATDQNGDNDYRHRRQSIVSFHPNDSGDPLQWSKKYKWLSVALLCAYAAVV